MNRRSLLQSAAAGLVLASLPPSPLLAAVPPRRLTVGTRTLEINGRAATVFGLTDEAGRSGLSFAAGDVFDVTLANTLGDPTLVHWHGLLPPGGMDGVPNLPSAPLRPDEERSYRFPVGPGGTHWMHSHNLQEQNLLAAPLIVRTAADLAADEQEIVVLLHDFSFTPAEKLLAGLGAASGSSGMGNMGGMSMDPHGATDMGSMDMGTTTPAPMSGMAGMMAMDLNDIAYDAYLANDRTLDDPDVVLVEKGGHVRLRLINGAASTAFVIDVGALDALAIAVDGNEILPVAGRRFPLTMGQRLDLRLSIPKDGGAFPLFALREGATERTGIILATRGASVARQSTTADANGPVLDLAFEAGLRAAAPPEPRTPDVRYTAHMMGTMAPYAWSIAGGPFTVSKGQRVEIELMNMSMMAHPMHLHGHVFQIVAINGQRFAGAVRDTVLVPPMQMVTIAFDAVNPTPSWAFHCHHLYHMMSGMMATLDYTES